MVYFLLIVTLNILHLVLTLLSIVVALDAVSQVVLFTDPLAAILTWRFLLALQVANQGTQDAGSRTNLTVDDGASLRFVRSSRLIGSLGESLGDRAQATADSRSFRGEETFEVVEKPGTDRMEHIELEGISARANEQPSTAAGPSASLPLAV
ncbi:hypothetical protein OH77DRAFT_1429820 [Trametes cingulata]|nr:hypothetical protein OH77DRAFT_1429820 [Trametes cingulata]